MEGAMFDLRGLLAPFRRDKKRDFASGSGPDLLRAKDFESNARPPQAVSYTHLTLPTKA